jgi:hypothetical protein
VRLAGSDHPNGQAEELIRRYARLRQERDAALAEFAASIQSDAPVIVPARQ